MFLSQSGKEVRICPCHMRSVKGMFRGLSPLGCKRKWVGLIAGYIEMGVSHYGRLKRVLPLPGWGYKSTFYKSMFYKSTFNKSTFYKSIFYKSTFYKSMFYKSTFYKLIPLLQINPPFTNPSFTNPCFTNPPFTNPCFTNPPFTNPCFYKSNPCFTNPIQSSPLLILQFAVHSRFYNMPYTDPAK